MNQNFLPCQNKIVTILQKQVLKQAVRGTKGNSEIIVFSKKYKDTPNNLIDSLDTKFLG